MFNFESLFESAPDAMVLINSDGEIVLINSQLELLFGYNKTELLGRPIELLIPDKLRSKHKKYRDGFNKNPRIRPMGEGLNLHGLHKDQTQFPVEISLAPIKGGYSAATIRKSTRAFFKNRWKWVLIPIIIMHLAQGVLLAFYETAGNTTSTATLVKLIPNHSIAGIVLIAVALLSAYQLFMGYSKWLLLPQFLALVAAMNGATLAIWNSAFADGVIRSRPFIAADQMIYIVIPWVYGLVVLEIYEARFRIPLGK